MASGSSRRRWADFSSDSDTSCTEDTYQQPKPSTAVLAKASHGAKGTAGDGRSFPAQIMPSGKCASLSTAWPRSDCFRGRKYVRAQAQKRNDERPWDRVRAVAADDKLRAPCNATIKPCEVLCVRGQLDQLVQPEHVRRSERRRGFQADSVGGEYHRIDAVPHAVVAPANSNVDSYSDQALRLIGQENDAGSHDDGIGDASEACGCLGVEATLVDTDFLHGVLKLEHSGKTLDETTWERIATEDRWELESQNVSAPMPEAMHTIALTLKKQRRKKKKKEERETTEASADSGVHTVGDVILMEQLAHDQEHDANRNHARQDSDVHDLIKGRKVRLQHLRQQHQQQHQQQRQQQQFHRGQCERKCRACVLEGVGSKNSIAVPLLCTWQRLLRLTGLTGIFFIAWVAIIMFDEFLMTSVKYGQVAQSSDQCWVGHAPDHIRAVESHNIPEPKYVFPTIGLYAPCLTTSFVEFAKQYRESVSDWYFVETRVGQKVQLQHRNEDPIVMSHGLESMDTIADFMSKRVIPTVGLLDDLSADFYMWGERGLVLALIEPNTDVDDVDMKYRGLLTTVAKSVSKKYNVAFMDAAAHRQWIESEFGVTSFPAVVVATRFPGKYFTYIKQPISAAQILLFVRDVELHCFDQALGRDKWLRAFGVVSREYENKLCDADPVLRDVA
eukprot:TRINITY_DN3146_c2_g1_i2.p1 TRINITY_DN3146_c2_g1~~TRINITY_DN3146_c2_g1_i2.p1  ORF type:complete len:703 (+),score=108.49 TRINITY_DN3146_c2_g1_i2:96-2111(+)